MKVIIYLVEIISGIIHLLIVSKASEVGSVVVTSLTGTWSLSSPSSINEGKAAILGSWGASSESEAWTLCMGTEDVLLPSDILGDSTIESRSYSAICVTFKVPVCDRQTWHKPLPTLSRKPPRNISTTLDTLLCLCYTTTWAHHILLYWQVTWSTDSLWLAHFQ